jgi:hypothetical protein
MWPQLPLAVELAQNLTAEAGDAAFDVATARRKAALSEGRSGRHDLYQAVCVILADRDQVFTRWKAGLL